MAIKAILAPKIYYVYELAYPESMGSAVFYVGKGTGNRINMHEEYARQSNVLMEEYNRNALKCTVIRDIWSHGEQVVKRIVFETPVEQDAYAYEWALIHMVYNPVNLTNKNNSGRTKPGYTPSLKYTQDTPPIKTLDIDGEMYITGRQAARYLGISQTTFYSNIQPLIAEYRHGAFKRVYYRKAEVEKFRTIEQIEEREDE